MSLSDEPSSWYRTPVVMEWKIKWVVVKNSPANTGDTGDAGSIPGSRRSPRGRNGNPLQYSCQSNPMDRGAWWTVVHEVAESDVTEVTECTHTESINHGNPRASFLLLKWRQQVRMWAYPKRWVTSPYNVRILKRWQLQCKWKGKKICHFL